MSRCYFADAPPRVEVRGDLIFIIPKDCGCEIALTPETLGKFVAHANRALDQIYERHPAGVLPLR